MDDVTKIAYGGGVKNLKILHAYFMDGPLRYESKRLPAIAKAVFDTSLIVVYT